jgi:hypothetical protein
MSWTTFCAKLLNVNYIVESWFWSFTVNDARELRLLSDEPTMLLYSKEENWLFSTKLT